MKPLLARIAVLILLASLIALPLRSARADVAPPEAPPGSTLWPGEEVTQVRMAAETVTMTVAQDPADPQGAVARTVASFRMRNTGDSLETMQARFPLRFMMWEDTQYPEIPDLRVRVDGQSVAIHREVQPYRTERAGNGSVDIPWAVFDISFPPGQDVAVDVSYTVQGYGYYPYEVFRYILETGAGWKDSIGTADVIVKLPYFANEQNVWRDASTGFSTTSPDANLSGDNEVRWHFEDLEPTPEDNIEVSIVTPSLWNKVVTETHNVTQNPQDGEAWGRLGKAYKEIVRMAKGYLRTDPVGVRMYELSAEAYERSLELLPEDSLWHTGYADLLWSHYYFDIRFSGEPDREGVLERTLSELQIALDLDPNNQLASDLLDQISYSIPQAVVKNESGYVLLGLTATIVPPTAYLVPSETLAPTISPITQVAAEVSQVAPTHPVVEEKPTDGVPAGTPAGARRGLPVCGGAALLLPAVGAGWFVSRKRIGHG